MEKMPYQQSLEVAVASSPAASASQPVITRDWQRSLPTLAGGQVVLRDLRSSDAEPLFALITTGEVSRFISPPPTSVEGFERFIAWTHRQREAGAYICFAITLRGFDTAIGIFQVRQLEGSFTNAEWGFALGSAFWGTGVFQQGAELVLDFVFDVLGVHRLEARAAVQNGRGNGALVKLGAVQEAVLRSSLHLNGEYLDQYLYSIVKDDRRASIAGRKATARVH